MKIGIDLDNTIICYDNSLHSIAVERGLISADTPAVKRIIRDLVRKKHGETEWQKLQIAIYGTHMERAELMPGVWDFLLKLKLKGINFQIVSHKTRYPNYGNSKVDLHAAAIDFLRNHEFFSKTGLNMAVGEVFFLPTRVEKISTISELQPDFFIDDLKELYMDSSFPKRITKILLSSEKGLDLPGITVLPDFDRISEFVFKEIENEKL